MTTLVQLARFSARPEVSEEFGARLAAIVTETRKEAGCLRYELYRDAEGRWNMFEIWADSQAVELHLEQPYVVDLLGELDRFISEAPQIEVLQPVI